MAKEKSLLVLAVVVVIVGIAAGFLYWKNVQREAAIVPEYNALPPPGVEGQAEGLDFPEALPDLFDIPDFTGELNISQ